VELILTPIHDALELVRAIDAFVCEQNGRHACAAGSVGVNRVLLIHLAAQHRLPAVYPDRSFVAEGGLMSYGSIEVDRYRGAASYVDRILRGAKVGDLPVQFPTKLELVVNLKTAKALGVTIPPTLLALKDVVVP
jgi:putative ABC transport system substrate-binding protein